MAHLARHDPYRLGRIDPFSDIDDMLKGFFVLHVTGADPAEKGHPGGQETGDPVISQFPVKGGVVGRRLFYPYASEYLN